MPELLENGVFTLKPYQVFSVHATQEELKTQHFGLRCLRKIRAGKSHDFVMSSVSKRSVFRPHKNTNSSGLKSGF